VLSPGGQLCPGRPGRFPCRVCFMSPGLEEGVVSQPWASLMHTGFLISVYTVSNGLENCLIGREREQRQF